MRNPFRSSGYLFVALFLTLAAHAASNVVEYSRDAAGNITQIKRQIAAGFAITGFDPVSGPVAATVTIYGTGFSATPANNTVKFNGTTATVTASDSGSISTTVPTGATSGRITVTVGANTVTSATDFVVTIPGAPTIASFTPTTGGSGTSVAITGNNFNTAAGATTVTLNGVTAGSIVASSSTSLSFTVPNAAASGRIVATTSAGAGMSAQDFIVPPPGTTASEIAAAIRLVPNGAAANLALGTANTRGLILFDGSADGYYTLQFGQLAITPSSAAIAYSIIKPDNTVLATGTLGTFGDLRPTIHVPKLPVSGTYSVLVSPGAATFNSSVKVVADPSIGVDGSPVSIALDTVSQRTRLTFTATAGQRIGLGVTGLTYVPGGSASTGVTLYKPDGSTADLGQCSATSVANPYGNCDAELLIATTGVHAILVLPPSSSAATLTMQLTSEINATLVADTGQDVTLTRVGQDARLTFTATAGNSLGLALSGVVLQSNPQNFKMTVYKPDGSSFTSVSAMPSYGALVEMGTLAASGTYTVVMDPDQGAFGTARLTLKTGPVLLATDPPSAFAPPTIAEAARFRFNGTAGQNLVVAIGNLTNVGSGSSSSLSIHRPDGTQLGQSVVCWPSTTARCKATLTNLPTTGVYSVVLAPPAGVKITGNASVSEDITGTLAVGTPLAVNAARDGQNARLTFSGTAGDSTSVKLYGTSTTPADQSVYAYVYKPDGSLLTSAYATAATPVVLDFGPLPATGTYQVLAYSLDGRPWQGTLALDPGATLVVDGAVTTVASATGEPLRYQFSGTAGQMIELGLTGLAYTPSGTGFTLFYLYRPGGTYVYINCSTAGAGACETAQATLPASGIYSVTLVPPGANAIAGGTLAVSTPSTGSFVVGDPAQTVSIQRPGQTARYTFSGTLGQLLRLNWTGATVSGGASVQVKVLKPDGVVLSTSSFANGASGGFDIASLPVAGTYTVVFDPSTAATTSASLALVTR